MNDVCYEKETTTKNIAEDVIEDTTENIFELLDDEILNELEKETTEYGLFYCEAIEQVTICFIYINKKNVIYHIKKMHYNI